MADHLLDRFWFWLALWWLKPLRCPARSEGMHCILPREHQGKHLGDRKPWEEWA